MKVSRVSVAFFAALMLVLVVAQGAFAAGHLVGGEVDYSADIATALVGLLAGIAASVAAGFGVAALARVTWKGARTGLRAIGLIK